jgi:hypothetical protein
MKDRICPHSSVHPIDPSDCASRLLVSLHLTVLDVCHATYFLLTCIHRMYTFSTRKRTSCGTEMLQKVTSLDADHLVGTSSRTHVRSARAFVFHGVLLCWRLTAKCSGTIVPTSHLSAPVPQHALKSWCVRSSALLPHVDHDSVFLNLMTPTHPHTHTPCVLHHRGTNAGVLPHRHHRRA